MAKVSAIVKNEKRKEKIKKFSGKRAALKGAAEDKTQPVQVRVRAMIQLSELPRNSSGVRYRNRCALTGRPRGYYRQFGLSRIMLRELGGWGKIPGLKKSSW
ncbi:MAG: 30S ribosomal protein S14 [Rickettsiales bacterium]|jgi:small subunit ribosomal protein S14|nr:30S ribosomal protein S14 [Rickettsiales bacterium]